MTDPGASLGKAELTWWGMEMVHSPGERETMWDRCALEKTAFLKTQKWNQEVRTRGRDRYTAMFIPALKQPKCSPTDKRIKKLWQWNTTVLQRKEILTYATTWIKLEDNILSEIKQSVTKGQIHYGSTYMRSLEESDSLVAECLRLRLPVQETLV